ncbi:conserved Plasmodium protein, unknown function [Plasmodium relictum]|uniref:Uncharacterized protein n=1 Tax=Plasmodium relictum TaxID=85471 RepID=A0A1J1H7J8_PLARL|nr:conserved Plasmodium protein, unknown function [Plasmodium relictum]CRH00890.1 conserved Plasmodium protein, unknown function [Plasmodium relictum]
MLREHSTKWTFTNSDDQKVYIHNYLDSLLDSDTEEYNKETYYESDNEEPIENKDTKFIDLMCIKTYVLKAKEILYGTLKEKEKLYLDICRQCKHLFNNEKECLNLKLIIKENHSEIKVPQLGLKFDKWNGINQIMIINYPVTYVFSKLLSFLNNVNVYDERQINHSCGSLLTKVSIEINKHMMGLKEDFGIFNRDVYKYMIDFRSIFITSYEDSENFFWRSCEILRKTLCKIKTLNNDLMKISSKKLLNPQAYSKKVDENLIHLIYPKRETNLHNYIKPICNFIFIAGSIVDEVDRIYNKEISVVSLKKRDYVDLFYLRDTNHVKNTCSVYVMISISWFFNQINLDIYNKNRSVKSLFHEKFSIQNLRNIVYSIYNSVNETKGDILDICLDSMVDIIHMMNLMILFYYEKENFLSRDNLTFSKLIKFTDLYIMRQKITDINKDTEGLRSTESQKNPLFNMTNTENTVCMMKHISNRMNFFISLLKKSYLRDLMFENYEKYLMDNIFIDNEQLHFCTSSGDYLIRNIFFNNVYPIISAYI